MSYVWFDIESWSTYKGEKLSTWSYILEAKLLDENVNELENELSKI